MSGAARSASGGVRNLLAMFENKDESSTSPPDRGRSPLGSIGGGGSNGTSPRPLSKVRTNFVAVERSGQLGSQWGLRKESSADPSFATRRASLNVDEEANPKAVADTKEPLNSELPARKKSAAITDIIPESAIETPPIESEKKFSYMNGNGGQGKAVTAESKPSGNPDKKTSIEERKTKLLPGNTTSSKAVSGGAALNNGGGSSEGLNRGTKGGIKTSSPKITTKTTPVGKSSQPTPKSTAQPSATTIAPTKSIKSPAAPKTPTSPTKTSISPGKSSRAPPPKSTAPSQTPSQTKPPEKKATKPSVGATSYTNSARRPSASTTVASISANKTSQASSPSAFHKPKPKSPTIPANLPARMTAPTASSLSKVSTAAAPSGRHSLAPLTKTVSRSPSHTSLAPKTELRRKPSKLENERPALGRPSNPSVKKQPSRQSLPKQTATADEGFLARMMRPTTSSASKTHEKVVTPPRSKPATRPTTREGMGHHKPHEGLTGSPSTKRLPKVTKTSKIEEPKLTESDEAERSTTFAASAIGINPTVPTSLEMDHPKKAIEPCGEPIMAAECQQEPSEEAHAINEPAVVVEASTAAEKAVDTDPSIKKPIIPEDSKTTVETPEPIKTDSSVEKPVAAEHPEDRVAKSVDANVSAGEPAVPDELEVNVPVIEEVINSEEGAVTNEAAEKSTEEPQTDDSLDVD